MADIRIKRIYDQAGDGYRVLVDRLWPRGIRKEDAGIDLWLKAAGPSDGLRREFGHDPEKFEDFAAAYRRELEGSEAVEQLVQLARRERKLCLLFGAKDEEHNQAVVLRQVILERLGHR
ncbi:DUF488 domain-containing protein [Arthrobacter mobilis]|uniref:DUF488 domain-containing protein n=1 Tax=Arthrobacter mobilis TaxID=2724944 RepID=UPI00197B44C2|nr:DUF488 family protein [Arthrobacter mobilis]